MVLLFIVKIVKSSRFLNFETKALKQIHEKEYYTDLKGDVLLFGVTRVAYMCVSLLYRFLYCLVDNFLKKKVIFDKKAFHFVITMLKLDNLDKNTIFRKK